MTTLPLLILAGPTASGKSAAALALAERLGGAVVNADSMQVYRDLRVLTARPDPADEARAPHALYGHVPAAERYSAGRYVREAATVVAALRAAGRVPILTGGTGLYLRAATRGLSAVPPVPAEAEREAMRSWDADPAAMRALLISRDPAAASLTIGDRQRHVRRAAVLAATGRTLTDWQAERGSPVPGPYRAAVLSPPRDVLNGRIDARAERMLNDALVEVAGLRASGLVAGPIAGALGVSA